MAQRRVSVATDGERRREEAHVNMAAAESGGGGGGVRQARRGSESAAEMEEDEWGSASDAGGGGRRPEAQLDYELAHVAIDTIALYRIKCKRAAEKVERLLAELQRERQRSEAARGRYEAMVARSGRQRTEGASATAPPGDYPKAAADADGRRTAASRNSKMGTRGADSPAGAQPAIPGDKEMRKQLLSQLEQLDERLGDMEAQNGHLRDMFEASRLENQSLLARARSAQLESQRMIRLQMASDRANEELKRRLEREKRDHERLYAMAEKHRAPDDQRFDPDAAGEQRDRSHGPPDAYPDTGAHFTPFREGSVAASRARSGRSAAPQSSEIRSQGMRPRETATARSDPDTAVRIYARDARSERESRR